MCRSVLVSFFLAVLLVARCVYAANTHNMGSSTREQAAWFGDMLGPHIVEGCIPATSGTTTTAALPCTAYVKATTGELVYVNQAGHAVGPLDGGDGTYWLAIHRDTSSSVTDWTRESASHYVWQKAATQPATPNNAMVVAKLTVASSAISTVEDLGQHSPRGKATVYTSQFASAASPIQAAINALPKQGGTVYIEPGTHSFTSTINLGSGDVGVASAKEGVVLECVGHPGRSKTEASTVLKYTGVAGSPVIAVKGPLVGWGIKNCYIDGNSLATVGVYVQSARGGDVSNIVIEGHTFAGIHSTCVPTGGFWNGATDSLRNKWYGIWIWHLPPAQAASAGIVLNSSSVSCNTDFNDFFGTSVLVSGVDGWGVYLGASDHNMFYNLHIFDELVTPTRSGVHFAYDNGIYTGWPCANNFYGVSLGETGMSASGTPLANNTCNNSIFGLSGGDPANFRPDLPGVTAVYGDRISQDLMLVAGRGADNDKTVGDVTVYTEASNPRHFVPLIDGLSDMGRSAGAYGAQRWKDIHLHGGVVRTTRGITTSPATLDVASDWYLSVGNVGGNTTLNLGSAISACGKSYVITNSTTNSVTLTPTLAQTINGAATLTLSTIPSRAILVSDCLNWHAMVDGHSVPPTTNTHDLGLTGTRWKDLYLSGNLYRPVRSASSDTSLNVLTDYFLLIANVGGATVVTLGDAVAACAREYVVKNTTSNNVVLTPSLSQTIDAGASFTLDASPSAARIISDCQNWQVLSTHGTH